MSGPTDARAALAGRIAPVGGLLPDHVVSAPSDETDAVLLDQFSRVHALRATTVIGRDTTNTIAVLQVSVSRRHAELVCIDDDDGERWAIADLGSRNGTFLAGTALAPNKPRPLADGQLVVIGEVGFVFVADRAGLPAAAPFPFSPTGQSTRRPGELRLSVPNSEGAGIAGHGEASVSLGSTQFALLVMLAERYLDDRADADGDVRGFVRSIELIAGLPWNTAHPEDNHVKQQVRRLRRALDRLGLTDAIESRHGFGYRLRVRPVRDAP